MIPILPSLKMNKTERRYAIQLEALKRSGHIVDWRFEALNFRMAHKTFYRPDFFIVYPTHFAVHEVKGYWEDDALVKFKVTAEMYPWFEWKAVQLVKGSWVYRDSIPLGQFTGRV